MIKINFNSLNNQVSEYIKFITLLIFATFSMFINRSDTFLQISFLKIVFREIAFGKMYYNVANINSLSYNNYKRKFENLKILQSSNLQIFKRDNTSCHFYASAACSTASLPR